MKKNLNADLLLGAAGRPQNLGTNVGPTTVVGPEVVPRFWGRFSPPCFEAPPGQATSQTNSRLTGTQNSKQREIGCRSV